MTNPHTCVSLSLPQPEELACFKVKETLPLNDAERVLIRNLTLCVHIADKTVRGSSEVFHCSVIAVPVTIMSKKM